MAKTKEPNYSLMFVLGVAIVLILHYFIISKFSLHPTLHVFISFILFWAWFTIIAMLPKKNKK